MNYILKNARKGARDVGRKLESKQLRANTSDSKFVVIATPESRTEILKEAEANPIKMGETIIENSKSEKYLGDQIHEDGTAASIHVTLDTRIPTAVNRGNKILFICNQHALIGFNISHGPVERYESKISSKILANSEGWISLNITHRKNAKSTQVHFMKVFQVTNLETPKCMVQLDSQTLKIKWQILLWKIKQVRKTNVCKQALIQGQSKFDGEDHEEKPGPQNKGRQEENNRSFKGNL